MLEEKVMESQLANEELMRENRSLKRQLRNLESTFQRNKAMLAARTTVNRMLESEQRRMERNMNLLLENSADIILLFDKDCRFSYYTKTFLEATGLNDSNLVGGKRFSEVFSLLAEREWIEFIESNIDAAMKNRSTISINSIIDLSGGDNPREYDVQITPMTDPDGNLEAFMILLHDITDIMRSKRQAESANVAKSRFLATMSHEIRTPLNAVLGMTFIGKTSADTERMVYCFTKIEEASKHLLGVINDILDVSKIESGKLELSPVAFTFENMLQRIVNIINFKVAEKNQILNVSIDSAIPNYLIGDDQRLAQVITNLLGNAVKFTPDGGIINLGASLLAERDDACDIEITVADTGIGVDREQQANLFQPFHQAENDTTRKFGGTGLGLSISKSIVMMMGGKIAVESEPGKGSVFTFSVQLKKDTDTGAGQDVIKPVLDAGKYSEAEQYDAPVSFAGHRVLLADDMEINREIVIALLEPTLLDIDCAENGVEAVRMFSEAPDRYSMIFMDIQMPEMDGYEATRRIRKQNSPKARTIPIIAMTANVFREDIEKCISSGMNAHIGKPLNFDEIIRLLRLYL